jgi:CRISPR-associated protein Csd1
MSWMQNLCDTYDACVDVAGIITAGSDAILIPLSHSIKRLNIVVHLKRDGTFIRADKCDMRICIPCTEESEGRTSSGAISRPHPLFDQCKYLTYLDGEIYLKNMLKWLTYLSSNQTHVFAYEVLSAVYKYMAKKTLISDIESNIKANENSFIGFCVGIDGALEDQLWMMPEMRNAWIDYYLNEYLTGLEKHTDICYATGKADSICIENHPKAINTSAANAKLISGNDKENYTFRGRFEKPSQAVNVSYVASQKAHQALRWLILTNCGYHFDTQAIITWAIDKQPKIFGFFDDSYSVYCAMPKTDAEKLIDAKNNVFTDYAIMMRKAMSGYGGLEGVNKHNRRVAIMTTDATTKNTGRMSITYYRELAENEYEERIGRWHNTCKWYQPFGKDANGSYQYGYFIGAPAVDRIALAILGKRRSKNDTSYDKLVKNLREQLVHCIFDGERVPLSMVIAASNRASNPLAFENTTAKSNSDRWRDWENVLGVACAMIKRYYHDYKKEEFTVELEQGRRDRDYLYGRLLAVADKIESSARYKQGKTKEDDRATNAVRYMTAFSQHPFRTWNMLFTQQLNTYIQQLNGAGWYFNLIGDIKQLFESGAFESDVSLDGKYLLGFFAQRQDLYKKQKNDNGVGGKENEFDEQN